jgi:hypothetical protein
MHGQTSSSSSTAMHQPLPTQQQQQHQMAGTLATGTLANGVTVIDDDDDDIIMGNSVVSLKDPMSGQRIVTAARFVGVGGLGPAAFDLDVFLEVAKQSKKWLDPHSMKASTVQHLQVSPGGGDTERVTPLQRFTVHS